MYQLCCDDRQHGWKNYIQVVGQLDDGKQGRQRGIQDSAHHGCHTHQYIKTVFGGQAGHR